MSLTLHYVMHASIEYAHTEEHKQCIVASSWVTWRMLRTRLNWACTSTRRLLGPVDEQHIMRIYIHYAPMQHDDMLIAKNCSGCCYDANVWNKILVRLDIQHMQHSFKRVSKTMVCPYQSETNTTKLWLEQGKSVKLNRAEHTKTNYTQKHETEPRNFQLSYPWSAHPSSPNLLSSQNNKSPTLELQNHQSPECKQVHIESESLAWSEALGRRLRCTVLPPVFPNYANPLWRLNQMAQKSLGIDCMYARVWM